MFLMLAIIAVIGSFYLQWVVSSRETITWKHVLLSVLLVGIAGGLIVDMIQRTPTAIADCAK